jgi:hypothetical protein
MQGKKMTLRWFRVATVVAVVPVFWIAVGAPVVAIVWVGLVLLAGSMLMAVHFGWGADTRSIAEVLHDLDAESMPGAVRVTSPAKVRSPRLPERGRW